MRLARKSVSTLQSEAYLCSNDWPEECFVQCGGCEKWGFFFEGFPKNPDTFIRGDSKVSIEDAEKKAWAQYTKILNCQSDHTDPKCFDKRGYTNGLGFCKKCNVSISIFEPAKCTTCGLHDYYTNQGNELLCKECYAKTPKGQEHFKELEALRAVNDEQLKESLKSLFESIQGK